MKCLLEECDPLTSSAIYFFIKITLKPETMQEAFDLGALAVRLRNRQIWCVYNYGVEPSLTVQVKQ